MCDTLKSGCVKLKKIKIKIKMVGASPKISMIFSI